LKLAYITNVFDPETKEKNKIANDSPAAFKKVFNVSQCIKIINPDISIISMGFINSTKKRIELTNKIIDGIIINYIKLPRQKLIRHIVIQFKLVFAVIMNKYDGIIIYNYYFDYFLLAFFAYLLKKKILVDIEDGINEDSSFVLNKIRERILGFYLHCSRYKALVVSSLLQNNKNIKKSCIIYGAGKMIPYKRNDIHKKMTVLFSGTIIEETGGLLLVELIKEIASLPKISDNMQINISGVGVLMDEIKNTAKDYSFVNCYGFLPDKEYKELLANTDIALVLKSNDNSMGRTTFPSKVVEFVLNRIAIMAIPSSDLPILFNNNEVIFINTVCDMIKNIEYFINNREQLEERKRLIAEKAVILFDSESIGKNIVNLIKS
jgi:glycosyltransferase involved in cell wall biosynthesis